MTTQRTIGYLGPHGTFTEQAVLSEPDLAACEGRLFPSMPAVLMRVEAGELDLGFAAIENSIEGTVNATIDTLAFSSNLLIQREVVIPISMQLLVAPGTTLDSIDTVVSFPHAIAQCRVWLAEHLPNARHTAANSTADAVELVAKAQATTTAAIGNSLAGSIYNLTELANDIEDNEDNQTRFVTVARSGVPKITGNDKTSIVIFQRDDRPGSLLSILQEFSARQINLSKLESRPTKKGLGNYCFIMDLDGHIADEVVADALKNIMAKQADVKFLGSYPTAGNGSTEVRAEANAAWRSAEDWLTRRAFADVMTEASTAVPQSSQERLVFALRQAALLAVALIVTGLVTERLRPAEAVDRGIVSTQFLWAIVLWVIVLAINAVAFENSQMRTLERVPLMIAAGIGFLMLVIGLISFDAGPLGRRLVYLIANSLGAAMFWWAVLSLGWLLVRRVAD